MFTRRFIKFPSPEKNPVHTMLVTPHPLDVYAPVAVNELPPSVPLPVPYTVVVPAQLVRVRDDKAIALPVWVTVVVPMQRRGTKPELVSVIGPLNLPE